MERRLSVDDVLLEHQKRFGIKHIKRPMPCGSRIVQLNMLYGDFILPDPKDVVTPFYTINDSSVDIARVGATHNLFKEINSSSAEQTTPVHACIQLPGAGKSFNAYFLAKTKTVFYIDFTAKFAPRTSAGTRYIPAIDPPSPYYNALATIWTKIQQTTADPQQRLEVLNKQFKEATKRLIYARIIHWHLWTEAFPEASTLLYFKACQNGQTLIIWEIFNHLLLCSFDSVKKVASGIIGSLSGDNRPVLVFDECGELKELQLDPHPHDISHVRDKLFSIFDPFASALVECRELRLHQVMCGTNLRLTHFIRQGELFSPFKLGELDISTDLEPLGASALASSVHSYFGITLPKTIFARWSGRGRIGMEGFIRQIFMLVKNPDYHGDLVADIVVKEPEWYNNAVTLWKDTVTELLASYGNQVVNATGMHNMTLDQLFKKIHRDIWVSNQTQVCTVSELGLLVDAGIMFLRNNGYQLIERVLVEAICTYFDQRAAVMSQDHILQHYLLEMQQATAQGARASYDVAWEFFTARLFMLLLQNPESRLFKQLVAMDDSMAHYEFRGRMCVSATPEFKTHEYLHAALTSSAFDDKMFLAENFSGGDLFLLFIRKPTAPPSFPEKRFAISQAKALTAASLAGSDYERAIATTQLDQQYHPKREDRSGKGPVEKKIKTNLTEDREKMEKILTEYPSLAKWGIGFLTIAGNIASSERATKDGHNLKLQLGLFENDNHFSLELWEEARNALLKVFNLAKERNKLLAQGLYTTGMFILHLVLFCELMMLLACKDMSKRESALAQIVQNNFQGHLTQLQLGELFGLMGETKKHNGERAVFIKETILQFSSNYLSLGGAN